MEKEIKSNPQSEQPKKKEKESAMQQKIDRQLQSPPLKDMHLESGEKINEYDE